MTNKKKGQLERNAEVAEALRRIRELPTEQQALILSELQGDELSRKTTGPLDALLSSLPSTDELFSSLPSIEPSAPSLDEAKERLLAAIDLRIDGSNRLKDYVRTVGRRVTKETIREWREKARTDWAWEKNLRDCRDAYGEVLRTSLMVEE